MTGKMNCYEVLSGLAGESRKALCTVLDGDDRGKKALYEEEKLVWQSEGGPFPAELSFCADPDRAPENGVYDLSFGETYAEFPGQEKHLIICGGGHVSAAFTKIAKLMEFRVTVLEDRPEFEENARRNGADEVQIGDYAEMLAAIPTGSHSYIAIMTSGHRFDRVCLAAALRKPSAYIGMIGSARKNAIVFDLLREAGFTDEELSRVHAPIGLSIGAETPAEIAVSIMAEIIEEKNVRVRNEGFSRDMMKALLSGKPAVLATIINKQGSAPRGTGSKMLIFPDGSIIGTVGGGRGEAEVIRLGTEQLAGGGAFAVHTVDMTFSGPVDEMDKQLICGGTIKVMLETVRPEEEK
ncbi:MAG: XdhC family protein [Lachnospiraceae bacterium]|nr:XdhC family protein [Lachnospiraceae bacterium]